MFNQKIKRNLIVLFYLSLFATLSASPNDSISTVYKNGEYSTYSQVWVNASDTVCCDVTKDFDHQMCYNVELLFGWALKGMNLRKEKKEIMMFYLKNTTFNKSKNELRCIGDVIVPGVITVPNVFVDAKLSSKPYNNGKSTFYLSLLNSNAFIRDMGSSFNVISVKNKGSWFILETNVKFAWFFNIFITQNRYKAIMEWRLKKYIHNLRDEAERRDKISKSH